MFVLNDGTKHKTRMADGAESEPLPTRPSKCSARCHRILQFCPSLVQTFLAFAYDRPSAAWPKRRTGARMNTKPIAGHSPRASCVTQTAMNGVKRPLPHASRPATNPRPCRPNRSDLARCSRRTPRRGLAFRHALTSKKLGLSTRLV